MNIIKEMEKMINEVKNHTEKGVVYYDSDCYVDNTSLIEFMKESYYYFEENLKELEILLKDNYDYDLCYFIDLEKIIDNHRLTYRLNEKDREKIEKYNKTIIYDIQSSFESILNSYNDFFNNFVFFINNDYDYTEFLDECYDLNENYSTINVHLNSRYQNIKDIKHFDDFNEIVDYATDFLNDEKMEKLDNLLKEIEMFCDYEKSIVELLSFIFLDNYDMKIIYENENLGLVELK